MKVHDILACPFCKSQLSAYNLGLICTNSSCEHSRPDNHFRSVDGTPILVSEISCDTVFSSANTGSLVVGSGDGGKLKYLKRHLLGESKTTKRNFAEFIQLVKKNSDKPRVLVIGGAEIGSGSQSLYCPEIQLISTDIYLSSYVDYLSDAHYLPFKSGAFDGVVIQAVLEHVVEPEVVVSEIHRVLKSDGFVYAETPFMQQVHMGAYDFTRYTVLGHRYLFKNFEKINAGGLDGAGVALAWSVRYFVQAIFRSKLLSKIIFVPFKYFLTFIEKIADPKSFHDANSGSYFLGKKSNKTISHKDLVKEYSGLGN